MKKDFPEVNHLTSRLNLAKSQICKQIIKCNLQGQMLPWDKKAQHRGQLPLQNLEVRVGVRREITFDMSSKR